MIRLIVAKLSNNKEAKITNTVAYSSICSYNNKLYYIYNEINKLFLNSKAKSIDNKYYLAIRINIINNIIEIYNESFIILIANKKNIIQSLNLNEFYMIDQDINFMKEDLKGHIFTLVDCECKEGRQILLQNFFTMKNMPKWINDRIKILPAYKFKRRVATYKSAPIDLLKVVGTGHSDYYNKTWLEMYYCLKRDDNIFNSLIRPEYYYDILQSNDHKKGQISYIKIDDEYYIDSGNHRTLLAKFKNLDYIYAPLVEYKTDLEYLKYYDELNMMGYFVVLPYYDDIGILNAPSNIKERWEVFQVTYRGEKLTLLGLEEIKEFYQKVATKEIKKTFISIIKRIKNLLYCFEKK